MQSVDDRLELIQHYRNDIAKLEREIIRICPHTRVRCVITKDRSKPARYYCYYCRYYLSSTPDISFIVFDNQLQVVRLDKTNGWQSNNRTSVPPFQGQHAPTRVHAFRKFVAKEKRRILKRSSPK